MYKYIYAMLCLFSCAYSYAQTRDFPEFPNPQNDFYKLLDENKLMNPRLLEGPVRDVNCTYIEHESPDNEETYMTNYFYRLEKDKEITEYITNDLYDNTTIPDLNKTLPSTIQNDTIIKEDDFYTYIYKKGKLTHYMAYDIENGILDSIVYTYKKDQLHTRTEYQSKGAIEVEILENGDFDDSTIYFTEFSVNAYSQASYSKKGQINSLKEYRFTIENDFIDTHNYSYTYDAKGRFESMKMVSNRYVPTRKNLKKRPKKWKFKNNKMIESMHLEATINTTYDTQDRIQTCLKTDSQKNKELYNISYGKDFNRVIVVDRDDYNNHNNTLIHRDLVYEYIYDTYHNPAYITSYIVVDGKKILDKSTRLQISYY